MKKLVFVLSLCGILGLYADQSSMQQAAQQKIQQFVELDGQIESIIKQRMQLQMQAAEHMQAEEDLIRPRAKRRQAEDLQSIKQQIQLYNQQLEGLESERSQLLLALSNLS